MSGSLDLSLVERASLFDALRQAAEGSGTGLAITDMSNGEPRNLFVSNDLARMLGYLPEEIVARDPWSMLDPEELPRLREMRQKIASGGQVPGSFETVLLHKSGARVAVELPRERRAGISEPERVGLPVCGEPADGQRSSGGGRGRHDERSD